MAKSTENQKGKSQSSQKDDDDKQRQQAAAVKAKAEADAKAKAQAEADAKAKADAEKAKAEKAKDDDKSKSDDHDKRDDDKQKTEKVKASDDREDDKSKSDKGHEKSDDRDDDKPKVEKAKAGNDKDDDKSKSEKSGEKSKSGDRDNDDDKQRDAAAAAAAKAQAEVKAKGNSDRKSGDHDGKGEGDCDKDDDKSKSARADADKKAQDGHDKDEGGKHTADGSKDGDKDKDDKSHDGDKKSGDHDGRSEHADNHDGGKDDHDHDHDHGTTPVVTPPVVTPPVVTPPVVTPPEVTPPAPVESLVLKAADVSNVGASTSWFGSKTADTLFAVNAHDDVFGRGGNDTIHGADLGSVTLPIAIDGALQDAADADALAFVVSGMPAGAALSAGVNNGDGTWSLTKGDLAGLSITAGSGSDFTLHVTASATDGSGLVENADLHVTMHAGQGNLLSGGSGNDTIFGSVNGDDMIYGGNVDKTGHGSGAADNDVIHVGNGNAHVWGQGGDDTIYAGGGKGSLWGGIGDDTVFAGSGSGDFHGGSGFDTLDFSLVNHGVTVDLKAKTATGDLVVKGFEAVVGSAHDDSIWGDANTNVFTGGAGSDTFGFRKSDMKLGNVDHITDFGAGDQLDLSAILHGKSQNLFVTETERGTTVSAKVGGVMHDVVVLDGVHGMSAQDMLAHGLILT